MPLVSPHKLKNGSDTGILPICLINLVACHICSHSLPSHFLALYLELQSLIVSAFYLSSLRLAKIFRCFSTCQTKFLLNPQIMKTLEAR